MSLIIAARFDTFDSAAQAAKNLMDMGISHDDLHTFFVNPAGVHDRFPIGGDRYADPKSEGALSPVLIGAAGVGILGALIGIFVAYAFFTNALLPVVSGAGVGAYVGSLLGAMYGLGRGRSTPDGRDTTSAHDKIRPAGVLLAVHATPESESRVASILRDAGGQQVEHAQGRWRDGRWEDFDPLIGPDLEKNFQTESH